MSEKAKANKAESSVEEEKGTGGNSGAPSPTDAANEVTEAPKQEAPKQEEAKKEEAAPVEIARIQPPTTYVANSVAKGGRFLRGGILVDANGEEV